MRRWGHVAREYRCLDCGHIGWSRHPDVGRTRATEEARDLNEVAEGLDRVVAD